MTLLPKQCQHELEGARSSYSRYQMSNFLTLPKFIFCCLLFANLYLNLITTKFAIYNVTYPNCSHSNKVHFMTLKTHVNRCKRDIFLSFYFAQNILWAHLRAA